MEHHLLEIRRAFAAGDREEKEMQEALELRRKWVKFQERLGQYWNDRPAGSLGTRSPSIVPSDL